MMNVIDYELTCNISCLLRKRIFIYGAGVYGVKVARVFSQMNIEISGFCETNPKKNEFLEQVVFSTNELIKNYDVSDVLVVIASEKYYKEMIDELQATQNMALCTYYALFISLYLNYEANDISISLRKMIRFYKELSLDVSIHNFLNSWWTAENYCNILSQPSLVWLYQPGKIASLTIHQSNSLKTHHFHSLSCGMNMNEDMYEIYNCMLAEIKENPIKIITGIREPISRDISAFFHGSEVGMWPLIKYVNNFWFYLLGDYSKYNNLNIQTLRKRICTLENSLNYSFEHLGKEIIKNKSDEFLWFDYEIKSLLGIDIYAYPFDKEKGYTIIEQGNIRILVYKCEKLNQLENVIGEFLEEPGFTLKNANQGEEKIYSYVYKKFKEEVKLNKEYFDYYYADNPKLKHFYTDAEIEQFKQKWEKKLQ